MNPPAQTQPRAASLLSWPAKLWQAKEERTHRFASVILPNDPTAPAGFGLGEMAHRAFDAACSEIGFKSVYGKGFNWPEIYTRDEAVQRDCLRSENERGDVALIYKL